LLNRLPLLLVSVKKVRYTGRQQHWIIVTSFYIEAHIQSELTDTNSQGEPPDLIRVHPE
jgi:hypothetical protein